MKWISVKADLPKLGDSGFIYSSLAQLEINVHVSFNPFSRSKKLGWLYKNPLCENTIMWREIDDEEFWRKWQPNDH